MTTLCAKGTVAARIIAGEVFGHGEIWRENEDVL